MSRFAIATVAILWVAPASAQIVCFQGDLACQTQQAAEAARRDAESGPGLISTIIGLSQQSELHEKQMQVLEAQRQLLEAQRKKLDEPASNDVWHTQLDPAEK